MKLLILDADVVIELHRIGIWDKFILKNKVYLAYTVIKREAQFYIKKGERKYFDLKKDIRENKIFKFCCSAEDIKIIQDKLDPISGPDIHEGELEAIAFLMMHEIEDKKFCICDKAVFRALIALGIEEVAISLEEVLKQCGLGRQLIYQFSYKRFKECMKKAQIQIIYDSVSCDKDKGYK